MNMVVGTITAPHSILMGPCRDCCNMIVLVVGSGKSYTMMGKQESGQQGIIPQVPQHEGQGIIQKYK